MADVLNFRSELRENPFTEVWLESQLSRDAWSDVGKHTHTNSYRAHRIQELEKELKEAKPVHEQYSSEELKDEKAHLVSQLDKAFGKEMRGVFLDEMPQFEVRAWANAISKSEIAETYKQIGRILTATGDKPLTPELRKLVAKDVIRNCSDPTVISQGQHNTCNVTAVEVRTYALHPAKAAKMIADIATTGEFRAHGGVSVKLDAASMVPDEEALKDRPAQGLRTYATQLFNLAAVNIWYSAARPGTKYQQQQQIVNGKPEVVERLVDYSSGKPVPLKAPFTGKVIDSPFLGENQIAFISDRIVGSHEPFAVIKRGPSVCWLPGETMPKTKATDIIEEQELPKILDGLKKRHLLPAIASVDTDVEPLNKDTGSGAYGPGGGHVENLFDYTGGPEPKVAMDNEWTKKDDHLNADRRVDLHEMYLCMAGTEAARENAATVAAEAKKNGSDAPRAELASLDPEQGSEALYAGRAAHIIDVDQDTERGLSGKERDRWFDALQNVVNRVGPAEKVDLLGRIQGDKVCSDEEFGRLIAGAVHSISYQKRQAAENNDSKVKTMCIRATTAIAEYLTTLPTTIKKSYFKAMRDA